jgi:DNA ligase (NAD+)
LKNISPEQLGELLIEAKKAYYTTGKPIMDDHTYDTLEDLLRQKAPYHRIFKKIGTSQFATGWAKKKHLYPMTSQNKVAAYHDLIRYFELKKIPANTAFVVQPKCDGLSLELIYQHGNLVDAITRGDGLLGDVVSQNVVKMKNFVLHPQKFTGSIRCEIVVTFKDFRKLNTLAPEKYANTRNAASGLTQRLDSRFTQFCSLFAVDLYPEPQAELAKSAQLQSLGFTSVDTQLCRNLSEVEKVHQKYLKIRPNYPFDIDGLVVKINDLATCRRLGLKDNRPKFQVAYKFPAASNQTRVKAVSWQVGPLGMLTPMAEIDPVAISGAVITFVSLANHALIKEKNINISDIVEISRRGDVIPHIDKVVTKVKTGHLPAPRCCPSCHRSLLSDHRYLRCPHQATCPAQILGPLRLFCDTLKIRGISDKTIEKLYRAKKIKLPGDFYRLEVSDFLKLTGLGQKSGSNIVGAIQAKKRLSLKQVFDAAVIPHLSAARIQQLLDAGFDTPDKILHLSALQLAAVPGFKATLAQKIVSGIAVRRQFIKSILSQVKLIHPQTNSRLRGQIFAITGKLNQPRTAIETLIHDHGGRVVSAVSAATSYLIANSPSASTKYKTAQKLGTKIITEIQFTHLLSRQST